MISNSTTLDGWFLAIVKSVDKNSRILDVYIPKLMPLMSSETKADPPMLNIIESDIGYSTGVKTAHTIKVRPFYFGSALPKPESKVIVIFIDENPNNGLWMPFDTTGFQFLRDYDVEPPIVNLAITDEFNKPALNKYEDYDPINKVGIKSNGNIIFETDENLSVDVKKRGDNTFVHMTPNFIDGVTIKSKKEI